MQQLTNDQLRNQRDFFNSLANLMHKHSVVSIDPLELWEDAGFQGLAFEFNVGSGVYSQREVRCDATGSISVMDIRSKGSDINWQIRRITGEV